MKTKSIFALMAAVALCSACKVDDAEYREVSEFGLAQTEYEVAYTSGALDLTLLSNEPVTVSFSEPDLDWATVVCTPAEDGQNLDTDLHIEYGTNSGYPRMATIILTGTTREISLKIKQKGYLTPTLKFNDISKAILGDAAKNQTSVSTNLQADDISVAVAYSSETDTSWISNTQVSNGFFLFNSSANPDLEALRRATVTLSFTDGWGVVTSTSLLVTQANAKNEFGTAAPFSSIRDMQGTISKDIYIEGIIISEKGNGNNGENDRLTETSMDLTGNDRTAYIQDIDGSCGYKILTSSAGDNVFERYSKVKILLRNAVVSKELNPERYVISKVTSSMLLSSEAGSSSAVPDKSMYIDELTDMDLYTWVTLKDCEFGVKKGPLLPINHGYCPEYVDYPVYRICKYPCLVIDNRGGSIYTITNTSCTYGRDGQKLPYGTGSLSGVLVHEKYDQYQWNGEANEGYIGRYQIRHLNRSDIDFADATSTTNDFICEYQYFKTDDNKIVPTNSPQNGYMIHTNPNTDGTNATASADFSYLGPCCKAYVTTRSGNGVILPDGTQLCKSEKTNWPGYPTLDGNAGKGMVAAEDNSAFRKLGGWWDYESEKPGAFLVNFSTSGITSGNLLLVLAIGNTGVGCPRYFNVDWSESGNPDVESDWTKAGEFISTDSAQWPNTRWWQLPGQFKQLCVTLPRDILGKSSVWLRLVPSCNKAGTATGYEDGTIVSNAGFAISYLAVRRSK